jgi:hypothetical protein
MESIMSKCVYGCGGKANFILKNGKGCCSKHHSSCSAIKRKMVEGTRVARQAGIKKYNKATPVESDKGTLVMEDFFVFEPKQVNN